MKRLLVGAFFLLTVVSIVRGQNSAEVQRLEEQKKKALAEVELTSRLLEETKQSTKNVLQRLTLLSRQITSRKKVIGLLDREIGGMDRAITAMDREINLLEKELERKKENYAASIRGWQKRKNVQDKVLYVLSADKFMQSFRRLRYLEEFSSWQKRQAVDIVNQQKLLGRRRALLSATRANKMKLAHSRREESVKLLQEEASEKQEIAQLNKKRASLQSELKKKQKQADDLNRKIEQQIAIEIARAEAERKRMQAQGNATGQRMSDTKGGYAMTKEEKQLSDKFSDNKGKLPWPIRGEYMVVSSFGLQQHKELKYVKVNNSGIDIQTRSDNDARAIFQGEVTRVFIVPGYHNSVIVRHGNYLTVYSNLIRVYVKAGDKVTAGQPLGKIFTDNQNGSTTILHFQLWKEKDKLNPIDWLDK